MPLKQAFPAASVGHAYASTEAGVGFAVNDGLRGFSRGDARRRPRRRRHEDRARLAADLARAGVATGYVGAKAALTDADGFVDTGDMIEVRNGRCYFAGRRGGIINIGGHKVHPEEIEAVINACPGVRMSRARAQRNPITAAQSRRSDVVLADGLAGRRPRRNA